MNLNLNVTFLISVSSLANEELQENEKESVQKTEEPMVNSSQSNEPLLEEQQEPKEEITGESANTQPEELIGKFYD